VHVGARLRQLRVSAGRSVRSLAPKSGFSARLMSQVAHGQVTPSIGSLECMAMTLGVGLGQFFVAAVPSPRRLVRTRARPRRTRPWSPGVVEALGPLDGSSTLAPGGRSGLAPAVPRDEKFALLVAGEVAFTLGDAVHVLKSGDAITFFPATPHQWENRGAAPASGDGHAARTAIKAHDMSQTSLPTRDEVAPACRLYTVILNTSLIGFPERWRNHTANCSLFSLRHPESKEP
jgi:transcriptional regulator with XRE-family HTH domain